MQQQNINTKNNPAKKRSHSAGTTYTKTEIKIKSEIKSRDQFQHSNNKHKVTKKAGVRDEVEKWMKKLQHENSSITRNKSKPKHERIKKTIHLVL